MDNRPVVRLSAVLCACVVFCSANAFAQLDRILDPIAHFGAWTALTPYFPDVTSVVDRDQHILYGLTCLRGNVGSQMVALVGQTLREKVKLWEVAVAGVSTVSIGFESMTVSYSPSTGRAFASRQGPEWTQWYASQCHFADAQPQVVTRTVTAPCTEPDSVQRASQSEAETPAYTASDVAALVHANYPAPRTEVISAKSNTVADTRAMNPGDVKVYGPFSGALHYSVFSSGDVVIMFVPDGTPIDTSHATLSTALVRSKCFRAHVNSLVDNCDLDFSRWKLVVSDLSGKANHASVSVQPATKQ